MFISILTPSLLNRKVQHLRIIFLPIQFTGYEIDLISMLQQGIAHRIRSLNCDRNDQITKKSNKALELIKNFQMMEVQKVEKLI